MKRVIRHNGQLVVDSLRHPKPMQHGQRIGDMIVSTKAKRQTSCGVEDGLEQTKAMSRRSNEDEVSV